MVQNKTDLTVIVPGIRPHNWMSLYNSVKSFKGIWEIIFISPYNLPDEMVDIENIVLIKDWGSPIRCQQIGLSQSKGEYITWAADDGEYYKDALNDAYSIVTSNTNSLVVGKYYEGDGDNAHMSDRDYYLLKTHKCFDLEYITEDMMVLNIGIVPKVLLLEVGGWDCCFEACPMSHSDLSIRLHKHGVGFILQSMMMFHCSHINEVAGEHFPIYDAQTTHDEPLFKNMYSNPSDRIKIELDNWKKSEDRWVRRFG